MKRCESTRTLVVVEDCALEVWPNLVKERQQAYQTDQTVAVFHKTLNYVSDEPEKKRS